jgi:hypothetical protein
MNFTRNRSQLNDGIGYATMSLCHHVENAARAIVYRSQGNQDMARWYAQQARGDLLSYLSAREFKHV